MVIPRPVVAHGGALGHQSCVFQTDNQFTPLPGGGIHQQFNRIHCLAYVAAAGTRDGLPHSILKFRHPSQTFCHDRHPSVDGGQHLPRFHRLELKDCRAAEDSIIDIKIWILRGGCDECHVTPFNDFQQRLLLLFIKILDLVQIQ